VEVRLDMPRSACMQAMCGMMATGLRSAWVESLGFAMVVARLSLLGADERAALNRDHRCLASELIPQQTYSMLLAAEPEAGIKMAAVAHCSMDPARAGAKLYRRRARPTVPMLTPHVPRLPANIDLTDGGGRTPRCWCSSRSKPWVCGWALCVAPLSGCSTVKVSACGLPNIWCWHVTLE